MIKIQIAKDSCSCNNCRVSKNYGFAAEEIYELSLGYFTVALCRPCLWKLADALDDVLLSHGEDEKADE